MENSSHHRRHRYAAARGGGDSPRLLRSKSGSTVVVSSSPPPPESQTKLIPTKHYRIEDISKAKTTQKARPDVAKAGGVGGSGGSSNDGDFLRFLPRSKSKIEVPRMSRSASTSPSAWALSPGRSFPSSSPAPVVVAPVPKSPASCEKTTKGGSGVSGVLKYFRQQKKVSPVLEEEYHRYRVMYNRLLQWRYANARADTSMANVKRVAQKKLFNGWVRIALVRNLLAEKRNHIQKLKHQIKLYQMLGSEMGLLNEWSRLEPKNVEAVGRVVRKLSAVSVCLPLVQNAEAGVMSVCDALSTAMRVMDGIKAMILEMHWQVERTCFLLRELSVMLKQQKRFFEELEQTISVVASLEVQEQSLRVHCIQMVKEVKEIGA